MRTRYRYFDGVEYEEHLVVCTCGAKMELRNVRRYGVFYGCTRYPECKGSHGAHPNGAPLGTPADERTKGARIHAHEAFDLLWKVHGMTRHQAYAWLAREMGITRKECHIANFTVVQCLQVEAIITRYESNASDDRYDWDEPPHSY